MRYFKGIDYVRENIKCPQLGCGTYGKWGALPLEVRYTLYEMCELIESQDCIIKELKEQKKKAIEYIKKNINYYYDEDLQESIYQDEVSGNEILKILDGDE